MTNTLNDHLSSANTLNEVLHLRSEISDSANWLTLFVKDRIEVTISYRQLLAGARRWASAVVGNGVRPNDRVLIVLPTERAFYEAFWGILEVGAVPVPVYPPVRLGQMNEYLKQVQDIITDCDATLLITNSMIAPLLQLNNRLKICILTTTRGFSGRAYPKIVSRPVDLALLQYTSGSTGKQKGVMLSHANLLANLRAIGKGLDLNVRDVALSWLPLYHDMGLIGLMLGTIYFGMPLVAMSPIDFLRKPLRWIRLISEHRATISAAPNFAYNLVARKAKNRDFEKIDLSCWRIALCGAEPIHSSTIENFSRRFEPFNFRPDAFFPAYGLAENSLAVSFSSIGRKPTIKHFDPIALEKENLATAKTPQKGGRAMVSVGRALDSVDVQIMNDDGQLLEPNMQGEVVLKGPSVMTGYYNNPEQTGKVLANGWLRTGDIGFIENGQLYISGRKKDIVIRAGRNYFAEDLELAVGSFPGVRPGGVCVFSLGDPERGTEKVILLAEATLGADHEKMADALRKKLAHATGCRPDEALIIPPRTLPKTSSGKIQRFKARQQYLSGTLNTPQRNGTLKNLWVYARALLKN
jgi:acyl-CoA synthetase (AMP-forming)/AMP-acid ligase II